MSLLVLGLLFVHVRTYGRFRTSWSQLTLFPTLWATLCCTLPYINPIGYLGIWSPPYQRDPYTWLLSYTGPTARIWVIAAWASLISQAVATGYMGSTSDANQSPASLIDHEYTSEEDNTPPPYSGPSSNLLLTMLLIGLALPSLFFTPLPLSVISTETTPLGVGCILPSYARYKHHIPTLEDYVKETERLQSSTKLLLWPEGAVTFRSEEERTTGFQLIAKQLHKNVHVGVSFEETFIDPTDSTGWTGAKRTGIALISNSSTSPHFIYYKRHLVPIAESFSLRHSSAPPALYTIDLPAPSNTKKSEWAPGPTFTRPISITASICLDFAQPVPFAALDSRPSFILGPANTWDPTIGLMMWNQAVQRANELRTTILWCDGGKDGVSGIAGPGHGEISQVGPGSWARDIGLEYPFRSQRTLYAKIGDTVLLLFWVGVGVMDHLYLPGLKFTRMRALLVDARRRLIAILPSTRRGNEPHPPNLLDA
ncbi:hypothetical protein BDQ17DRAFT_1228985 [Cyathus striatus]|nr:hypothetical protein BDQ17DRAFT_1228985 [Cyathus striatus]